MSVATISRSFGTREVVALAVPAVIPPMMAAVFSAAGSTLGAHRGYLLGFGAYWATCGALALGILRRRRIAALFADRRPRAPRSRALWLALLAWPAAGAVATRFLPELRDATPLMVITSLGVASVNAVVEEVLWRGVYVTLWPNSAILGWVWPAIGFGAWHLAPQVIHPSALGPLVFTIAATVLGLSWGWVAWRTGSLRWVSVSHVMTDGSGLKSSLFFLAG